VDHITTAIYFNEMLTQRIARGNSEKEVAKNYVLCRGKVAMFELVGIAPSTETIPGIQSIDVYPRILKLALSDFGIYFFMLRTEI